MHFAPEIDQPRLKTLFRYWVEKRGALAMPPPGAIRLAELPQDVRRNVIIFRVGKDDPQIEGGLRFKFETVGEALQDRYGEQAEGLWLEDILGGHELDVVSRVLESVVRDHVVHFYRTVVPLTGGGGVLHTKLLLPLGVADGNVTAVLGGLCRGQPPADGTLENNYHSRFAALAAIEDRPSDFS